MRQIGQFLSQCVAFFVPNAGGVDMRIKSRILFVSQEISPYIEVQTPIRVLNRALPELCQSNGFETRTFMPKFGEVSERRHQLHDVIRLSGMNISIDDVDHPLLIKVTSVQQARLQIYFIDNDDLFHSRKGIRDAFGEEYSDNDVRTIFYARGVMETIEKLRWPPKVIYCSGWMSALIPLYVKRAFGGTPFFADAKVVVALDNQEYIRPFSSQFSEKLMIDGLVGSDVRSIADMPVYYEDLMHLAIDYADAVVLSTPHCNSRLINYAENRGKTPHDLSGADQEQFLAFFREMTSVAETLVVEDEADEI